LRCNRFQCGGIHGGERPLNGQIPPSGGVRKSSLLSRWESQISLTKRPRLPVVDFAWSRPIPGRQVGRSVRRNGRKKRSRNRREKSRDPHKPRKADYRQGGADTPVQLCGGNCCRTTSDKRGTEEAGCSSRCSSHGGHPRELPGNLILGSTRTLCNWYFPFLRKFPQLMRGVNEHSAGSPPTACSALLKS
jgi:hypothetical protein